MALQICTEDKLGENRCTSLVQSHSEGGKMKWVCASCTRHVSLVIYFELDAGLCSIRPIMIMHILLCHESLI